MSLNETAYPIVSKSVIANASPALVIKYIGTQASAKVKVATTTGDIYTIAGAASAETATNDAMNLGTTTGSIIDVSDGSYDTFGEVLDGINSQSAWKAYLVGAIRADSINGTIQPKAFTQCKTDAGATLYWLKGTAQKGYNLTARIGDLGFPSANVSKYSAMDGKRAQLYEIKGALSVGTASVSTISVYEVDNLETETLIYYQTGATATTQWAQTVHPLIESNVGKWLVVRYALGSTGSQVSTSRVNVVGRTFPICSAPNYV